MTRFEQPYDTNAKPIVGAIPFSDTAQGYTLTANVAQNITVPDGARFVYVAVQAAAALYVLGAADVEFPPFYTSGYQVVDVGGAITGGSATGLANDATVYTASVSVGGTPNAVAVTGSAAQTYTDLLTEINNDISGATAAIVDGNVRITNDGNAANSTIAITDTDLFASLSDFVAIETAVAPVLHNAPVLVPSGKSQLFMLGDASTISVICPSSTTASIVFYS